MSEFDLFLVHDLLLFLFLLSRLFYFLLLFFFISWTLMTTAT